MGSRTPESELLQLLEDPQEVELGSTTEAAPLPLPATEPATILASLGGLASAQALADHLQPSPSLREIRDRLKSWDGIRKLGGGYYALEDHPAPTLQVWLTQWLGSRRLPEIEVVDAILAAWAHGHAPSIHAWLHQDPGPVRVGRGEVWIFIPRRHRP